MTYYQAKKEETGRLKSEVSRLRAESATLLRGMEILMTKLIEEMQKSTEAVKSTEDTEPEQRKPQVWWLASNGAVWPSKEGAERGSFDEDGSRTATKVVEMLPGSVQVNREKLMAALAEAEFDETVGQYRALCKALGLGDA